MTLPLLARSATRPTLRPYQDEAVGAIFERWRAGDRATLLVLATGLGKTIVFSEIVRRGAEQGRRCLILAHRTELLDQAADKLRTLGVDVALEQADKRAGREAAVVASVQTLQGKRLEGWQPDHFALVVIDECFPAGTPVDGRPIETIKVGDKVRSFNHATGRVELRRVARLFASRPTALVTVHLDDGRRITCTAGHPFFTGTYVAAAQLQTGDAIYGDDSELSVHEVRPGNTARGPEGERSSPAGPGVLLDGVSRRGSPSTILGDDGRDQSAAGERPHDSAQPDAVRRLARENETVASGDGARAAGARRERDRALSDGGAVARRSAGWVGGRVDRSARAGQRQRVSDALQAGSGLAVAAASDRSGRHEPWAAVEEGARRSQAELARVARVARVEVHERRGSGWTGSVCPDDLVFNLEVEGNHNYFVDGVLVHNCHHAASKSYRRIIDHFAGARVLGVTATPDRGDGKALGPLFDSVAYRYEIGDGIKNGWLSPITARRVVVDGLDLSAVRTTAGDLNQGDLDLAMRAPEAVHGVAVPLVELSAGRQTLAFTVTVEHAHALAEAVNELAPGSAVALDGTAARDHRAAVLRRYHAGEIRILVNCLDAETEILTDVGWMGVDSFDPAFHVATMNLETGGMEWQLASRIVRRPRVIDERMVRIKNQTLDVRVTEGHRMVVARGAKKRWSIAEASTLPSRQGSFLLPVAAFGQPNHRVELSLDECRFIGLWITDGHLDRSGGHRGITIGQSTRYADSNEAIVQILSACGFDWKMTSSTRPTNVSASPPTQNLYRVPKGTIGGQLARRGFAHLERFLDKRLLPELLDLDRDQARALFEGIWLGDGVKERGRKRRGGKRRSWSIVNTDRVLLDRLQALAVTRGFAANLSAAKDNGPLATKPIYTLRIRDRAYVQTNNHTIPTSGGNPAAFDPRWREEEVWCVTVPNGTIITRRHGKALVMGQCALFTEGFDAPATSCIAIARPTKSRALYAQMVGRGTRLSGGKTDCRVLDFAGIAGKHKLVGPADVLAGRELDDEERREAEALLGGGPPSDVLEVLGEAAERVRKKREAKPQPIPWTSTEIDIFGDGLDVTMREDWVGQPLTDDLRDFLEYKGVDYAGFDRAKGDAMARALKERQQSNLCTYKQAKTLVRHGVKADKLSFSDASFLLDSLAKNNWRPTVEWFETAKRWAEERP